MLLRVFFASALAAIVLFLWGFIFWTVLPLHWLVIKKHPKEEVIVGVLKESTTEGGVYAYPRMAEGDNQDEWLKKHKSGPVGMLIVVEGRDPMAPTIYLQGILHFFVSALIAGALLSLSVDKLPTFFSRFMYIGLLGVFATFVIYFADYVWFFHPIQWPLLRAAYSIIGWFLAGLVMAPIIKAPAKVVA